MSTLVDAERRSLHERRFYVGAGIVMLAAVVLGFGRTYFLRPWFPEAAALADMMVPVGMMWSRADLGVDLFLVAMITWDLISRRSIHPVTLIGAVVVIASQPLRMLLSETSAWMSFAAWAVRLPGS